MDNQKFVELAKKAVVDYFNSHKEITDKGRLTPEDVYVVWLCKTLQNNIQKRFYIHIKTVAKSASNFFFMRVYKITNLFWDK